MSSNLIHATAVTTDLLKRNEFLNFRRVLSNAFVLKVMYVLSSFTNVRAKCARALLLLLFVFIFFFLPLR
jgi:hypothetical protein